MSDCTDCQHMLVGTLTQHMLVGMLTLHGAGYDILSEEGYKATMQSFSDIVGWEFLSACTSMTAGGSSGPRCESPLAPV